MTKEKRLIIYFIAILMLIALLFFNLQARNTDAALRQLDHRIRQEFGASKADVAYYLMEHEYSAALSEAITRFRMASLYGYYLDGRAGGDPQWLILAEQLREVNQPDIFKHLSKDDHKEIAQFLEEHEYKNDPPITEEDIVPLVERMEAAVDRYISE